MFMGTEVDKRNAISFRNGGTFSCFSALSSLHTDCVEEFFSFFHVEGLFENYAKRE